MIKTINLAKTYKGDVEALSDVSVEITKGEFVFLVGPSGSGKSTLIKILMKDEEPTSGEVWVAGKELRKMQHWRVPYLRRTLGVVFQDFKLLPNKTVYENVAFALQVIGRSAQQIANLVPSALELVGLSDRAHHKPDELSGGEQQRVCIARAFVNRPMILIADEPTGNLDPMTSLEIVRLLDRINRTGATVVVATHDHAVVDMMRRRVIELEKGQVVRDQARGVYGPVGG
jgi:cell division transport system ATP-binding protein